MDDAAVDHAALDQLASDIGRASVADVLRAALEEIPELTDRCLRALAAGDLAGVAQACHALTSAAALVGANGVSDLAGALEHAIKSKAIDEVTSDVRRLSGAVAGAVPRLVAEAERFDAGG